MTDVQEDTALFAFPREITGHPLVYTTELTGYLVHINGNSDLVYAKTDDGGKTWASEVNIRTGTLVNFAIWYDRWTPGNTGTKIHCFFNDTGTLRYRALDTTDDSLGTDTSIVGSLFTSNVVVGGCVAKSGILYVLHRSSGSSAQDKFYSSSDSGANWGSLTAPSVGSTIGFNYIAPGPSATVALWNVYYDRTNDDIYVSTYNESGASWSAGTIIQTLVDPITSSVMASVISLTLRHYDHHLILGSFDLNNTSGNGANILRIFDIENESTVTQKTDVYTVNGAGGVAICIDQTTRDIYVAYAGRDDGTGGFSDTSTHSCGIVYKVSKDGGTTWSREIPFSDSDIYNPKYLGCDQGGVPGRFQVVWGSGNAAVYFNNVNSVPLIHRMPPSVRAKGSSKV